MHRKQKKALGLALISLALKKVDAQIGTEPPIMKAPPRKGKHPLERTPWEIPSSSTILVAFVAQDARSMWCCLTELHSKQFAVDM